MLHNLCFVEHIEIFSDTIDDYFFSMLQEYYIFYTFVEFIIKYIYEFNHLTFLNNLYFFLDLLETSKIENCVKVLKKSKFDGLI